MPKRTNDFQRLVYLVRLNMAEGSTVTESKMLVDRITGRKREVDVCIEGLVGGQPIRVCVECRDHKRVAEVSWVDAMKAKHERVPTNALLLASRKGFTPEAKDAARSYGIETFSLPEMEGQEDKVALQAVRESLFAKTVQFSVEKVVVSVLANGDTPAENVAVMPDNLVYAADGLELGPIQGLVQRITESRGAYESLLSQGVEEHTFYTLTWETPIDVNGNRFYLQKTDPKVLKEVSAILLRGPCKFTVREFGVKRGQLGAVSIIWGKAELLGRDLMVVGSKDEKGNEKVSVNVRGRQTPNGGLSEMSNLRGRGYDRNQ
ncbi:MAG TPA: hypothetical protein VGM84_26765 [Steroidobacteraceae bacterium]|jgi:hypothetical protein